MPAESVNVGGLVHLEFARSRRNVVEVGHRLQLGRLLEKMWENVGLGGEFRVAIWWVFVKRGLGGFRICGVVGVVLVRV